MKDLPSEAGAYALIVQLDRKTQLPIKRLAHPVLTAGRYLYAGSANGPGGLRARVGRHLNTDKKKHWHIDHVTGSGKVIAYAGIIGGDECALVDLVLSLDDVETPIVGFGSSDCRQCTAHLLSLPSGLGPVDVLKAVNPDVAWLKDQ